jgi:hypothetical protein
VRFASVYRDFRDASDFQAVLRDIASDIADVPGRRRAEDIFAPAVHVPGAGKKP